MIDLGDWNEVLNPLFADERYLKIREFLKYEYSHYIVYPDMYDLYNCFRYTPYANVKVVLLGQDPYHEPNQAHGLCFSVQDGVRKSAGRGEKAAVARKYAQRAQGRLGVRPAALGQPHQVGEGGSAPTQYLPLGAGTSGQFARKLRVELVHRQRDRTFEQTKGTPRLSFMGRKRKAQSSPHRQEQAFDFGVRPPLSPLGVQRFLRVQALLENE